jgi:hypothetical protein
MLTISGQQIRPAFFPSSTGEAVGQNADTLRDKVKELCESMLRESVFFQRQAFLYNARHRIRTLALLNKDWDSYGAEAPGPRAINNALRIVDLLEFTDAVPSRILASAEGGVGICFEKEDKYADIECTNTGEFLGVRYEGAQMPRLIEITGTDSSLRKAIQEIQEHIRG